MALTAETRVRSQVNPCGICGGHIDTKIGSALRLIRLSIVDISGSVLHNHSLIYQQIYLISEIDIFVG
jgi:hypothetical protein